MSGAIVCTPPRNWRVLILSMRLQPVSEYGITLEEAKAAAKDGAIDMGYPMVAGWQQNDTTLEREYGFCPFNAMGPAFVVEPLFVYLPDGSEQAVEVVLS